ncbi:MAG: exodeoxyribonuclease VII large subunit, partial [Elusimicrobiota bacterium]
LAELTDAAEQILRDALENLGRRLTYAIAHPLLSDPRRLWEQRVQRVDELAMRLPEALRRRLENLGLRLGAAAGRLDAISPLNVLARGYAIATSKGKVLTSARQVKKGDPVTVRLSEGEINCEVS